MTLCRCAADSADRGRDDFGNEVAHSASEVFHADDCPQAAAITGEARLTGADAVAGRVPHQECTGMHEAMP